jgi:hypothetical protein
MMVFVRVGGPSPSGVSAKRPATSASLISLMPESPDRARAPRRTILMPFHSFGLWEAVMMAPPSRSALATA